MHPDIYNLLFHVIAVLTVCLLCLSSLWQLTKPRCFSACWRNLSSTFLWRMRRMGKGRGMLLESQRSVCRGMFALTFRGQSWGNRGGGADHSTVNQRGVDHFTVNEKQFLASWQLCINEANSSPPRPLATCSVNVHLFAKLEGGVYGQSGLVFWSLTFS